MKSDSLAPLQPMILLPHDRIIASRLTDLSVPSGTYVRFFKRSADFILASLLILLLLSWMLPLLLILVCLESKGPLFFVQKRVGYRGKVFPCFKIRSMRLIDAEKGLLSDEARITKIGWWLRLTHIDELPQLFNVLRNEMSLVGPRPHMLSHDAQFSLLLPEYKQRQLLRPGLTGLAQARGFYGEAADYFSIAGRTKLDLFYISKISPGLDFLILVKTFFVIPTRVVNRVYAGRNDSRQ